MENQGSLLNKNTMELQVKGGDKENMAEENMQEQNPLDFLTPENLQLAQKILAIELILIRVLENVPEKLLVNFRLVNKTWEKAATTIIMKRLKTLIKFDWNWKEAKSKNGKLRDLNECISKSRRFPCGNFCFHNFPLDDADLEKFCTLHGSQVKGLDLELHEQTATSMGNFLLVQVPNVQELYIVNKPGADNEMKSNPTRLFPDNSVLPHLKSFIYCDFPWASEIIQKSPELEKVGIRDPSWNGVETLVSMNKIHLLKQVSMENSYSIENILLLELLANSNPKLEDLGVDSNHKPKESNEFLQRRFVNALSKILESSKETMTNLVLCLDEHLLMGVKWPRLEKVKDLMLTSEHFKRMDLPPNFMSDVFPNIRTLLSWGEFVPSIFNCQLPLTHLQRLKLSQNTNWNLDNLASFAPNLRELDLSFVENFPEIAASLWACSGLKQLEIELSAATNSFPQFDMAFTGLSEEVVRRLHRDPEYFYDMKWNKKNIPRSNPSVLNCPDLTTLAVGINSGRYGQPLMTTVSGEFGFNMLENLRVKIRASPDHAGSLHYLKAYARLSIR